MKERMISRRTFMRAAGVAAAASSWLCSWWQ